MRRFKSAVERVPEPLGRILVHVPFSWRLGPVYGRTRAEIAADRARSDDEQREIAFRRFRAIVAGAFENNAFYRDLYTRHRFRPEDLRGFDDIAGVPIVRKEDLRSWPADVRSAQQPGRLPANTGGTSGEPLEFYLDRNAFAREWAHMHTIWQRLGYRQTDLKLTFRGTNLGSKVTRFNPVHNEVLVSAYHTPESVCAALRQLVERREIRFIHGYPSAIYEFARYAADLAPDLVQRLRGSLRGVFFGSEYPAPTYRSLVEETFSVPTISWYGHSEMAVLAYERDEPYSYVPFHTYGLTEAVASPDGHRLVGTSFHNTTSHFIRYDTGDLVEPVFDAGLLQRFRVTAGRRGDFVVDRNGHRVSLTALIFGRHHPIFGAARFVQICQPRPGEAWVLVTPRRSGDVSGGEMHRLFDTSGVDIDFAFQVREEPVRTAAGKVPLLVAVEALDPRSST